MAWRLFIPRNDNPFHNLDSAYRLIRVAEDLYKSEKSKNRDKYKEYGYKKSAILKLKETISQATFEELLPLTEVPSWTLFVDANPSFTQIDRAIFIRDSLDFENALEVNTSERYATFLSTYPSSELIDLAQEQFYKAQYQEKTNKKSLVQYLAFIDEHPENPYFKIAQDEVYGILTQANTIDVLKDFVYNHPKNRNVNEAWRRLYQVFMYEYSEERIEIFQKEFLVTHSKQNCRSIWPCLKKY